MAGGTDHYRICCSCKEWYPVRWRLTKWSEPCDSNVFCRDCARIVGCVTPLDKFKYGGSWYGGDWSRTDV